MNLDFPGQVQDKPELMDFLIARRRGIHGPRTLEQAYTEYRRLLTAKVIKLPDLEREQIRRLDPRKVNWTDAYAWWKDRDETSSD